VLLITAPFNAKRKREFCDAGAKGDGDELGQVTRSAVIKVDGYRGSGCRQTCDGGLGFLDVRKVPETHGEYEIARGMKPESERTIVSAAIIAL